jgi:hypothetical protein
MNSGNSSAKSMRRRYHGLTKKFSGGPWPYTQDFGSSYA